MRTIRVVVRPRNEIVNVILIMTTSTVAAFFLAKDLSADGTWWTAAAVLLALGLAVVGLAVLTRLPQFLGRLVATTIIGTVAVNALGLSPWAIVGFATLLLCLTAFHGSSPEVVYLDPLPEGDLGGTIGSFVGGFIGGALGLGMSAAGILGELGEEVGTAVSGKAETTEEVYLQSDFDTPIFRFWPTTLVGLSIAIVANNPVIAEALGGPNKAAWVSFGAMAATSAFGVYRLSGATPVLDEDGEPMPDIFDEVDEPHMWSAWTLIALPSLCLVLAGLS